MIIIWSATIFHYVKCYMGWLHTFKLSVKKLVEFVSEQFDMHCMYTNFIFASRHAVQTLLFGPQFSIQASATAVNERLPKQVNSVLPETTFAQFLSFACLDIYCFILSAISLLHWVYCKSWCRCQVVIALNSDLWVSSPNKMPSHKVLALCYMYSCSIFGALKTLDESDWDLC